jgi:hypothetical protein
MRVSSTQRIQILSVGGMPVKRDIQFINAPQVHAYSLHQECVRKSGVGGVGVGWAHASDNTLQTPDFTSCSAQRKSDGYPVGIGF